MNKVSLILTGLMTLTLVVFMAPNIIAMNHGKVLRNIALWLAVFLGLAIVYRTFGPGSHAQLFQMPPAFTRQNLAPMGTEKPEENTAPGKNL
jgi:hypothetical protein